MDEFAGLKKKSKKKQVAVADVALPGAEELEAKEKAEAAAASAVTSSPATSSQPQDDAVRPLEANADLPASKDGLDDFADLKKKKKKKAVALDLEDVQTETPAPATESTPAEPADDFADLVKKKRKKKVTLDVEEDAATAPSEAPAGGDLDFSDIKKKKSKKTAVDLDAFAKEIEETTAPAPAAAAKPAKISNGADNSDDDGDFDGEVDEDVPEGEDPFTTGDGADEEVEQKSKATLANEAQAWLKEDRDYEYIELLGHFYAALYATHPGLSGGGARKAVKIPPPSMHRDGNKRSVFANVSEICRRLRRQPEHVIQFLFAELGTTGSVDGSSRLIIKGRFQQKQIESVLRRYILEYVTCKTCKSPDTLLAKENRLYFVTCQSCGSHRSVSAIQAGFKAQIAKRRAQAAKAAG